MTTEFAATHLAPPAGLASWAEPDGARPTAALAARLPVQVVERRGDWARVVCSNGWVGWVDGRLLISTDPVRAEVNALFEMLTQALARYQRVVNDAAEGHLTPEEFRRQVFAIGHIVHNDVAWLLDVANHRWVRYDGIGLKPLELPDA